MIKENNDYEPKSFLPTIKHILILNVFYYKSL